MIKFYKIIVFFDLPTKTKEDRRHFAKFRQFLLKSGYTMLQYSVYVRTCDGYDRLKIYKDRLKQAAPPNGSIRVLTITQAQYNRMEILIGERLCIDALPEYEQLTIA